MRAVLDGWYRLLRVMITVLMVALVIPVGMQILSRYTGVIPRYIWTEEIARFCFVWIIMIGSMIAVRDGTHFDVDVLPHSSNRTFELVMRVFSQVAILVVALTFIRYGWDFGILGLRQQSEISGLPMLWIYGAWPLAGLTWVAFASEKIFDAVSKYRRETANGAG